MLANYERHRHHAVTRNHQWFEEAMCEVASLYTLKALSGRLAACRAQRRNWLPRRRGCAEIAQRFQRESHRRLPPGRDARELVPRHAAGSCAAVAYDRDRNEIVANLMLPLFEENPELWGAIGFLNLDAPARPSSSICRSGSTTRRRATRT